MKSILAVVLFICILVGGLNATPVPSISVAQATLNEFIGESFDFVIYFTNKGTGEGLYPFVDIFIPQSVVYQGDSIPNPLSSINSISIYGEQLTLSTITLTNCAQHPFAVSNGAYIDVCGGQPGTLVSVELPFSSFFNDQPAATLTVSATVGYTTAVGAVLPIYYRGGFEEAFGDNPYNATSFLGATGAANTWSVTNQVLLLAATVTVTLPGSTVTGPSYSKTATATFDVANGIFLSNVIFYVDLPQNISFLSYTTSTSAFTLVQQPIVGTPALAPNNRLAFSIANITGTAAVDFKATFSFFVPKFNVDGTHILNPLTGATGYTTVSSSYSYSAYNITYGTNTTSNAMALLSIDGGASATPLDARGFIPGNRILNTITWWVSDYFAFGSLFVQDLISTGHTYLSGFTPTLDVTGYATQTFTADAYTVSSNNKLAFNVSQMILAANNASFGAVVGATSISIKFHTNMSYSYTLPYTVQSALKQGDLLHNNANLTAAVRNFTKPSVATGYTRTPAVQADIIVSIDQYSFSVVVHATNNTICSPYPCTDSVLTPGELVTLRVYYHHPITTFKEHTIKLHLQAPLFDATQLTSFSNVSSSVPPKVGTAQWGAADTAQLIPTITTDATTNYVILKFGTHVDPTIPSTYVELLFTFSITYAVYKDAALFTSVGENAEGYLPYTSSDETAVTIVEPFLVLTTGFVATSNANGVFSSASVGPVAFNTGACPLYSSSITTAGLKNKPIVSDIANLDASDTATFAVVVQNTGHSRAFNVSLSVDLSDLIYTTQALSNLCVRFGSTKAVAYSVNYVETTGSSGTVSRSLSIDLKDSIPGDGVLSASATDGSNIVIVTFDIITDLGFINAALSTASASLCNYASGPSGPNFVDGCTKDNSTLAPASLTATHALSSTSLADIPSPTIVAGEQATYLVTLTFPEGNGTFEFVYKVADPKIWLVSLVPQTIGANLVPSSWSLVLTDEDSNGVEETATLKITLKNTPDNVADNKDKAVLRAVTQVIYNTTKTGQQLPAPTAEAAYGLADLTVVATPVLNYVAPTLTVSVGASLTTVEAKQIVSVTLTVSASGSPSPGYDLVLLATIPPQLHVTGNTLAVTGSGKNVVVLSGSAADSAVISVNAEQLLSNGNVVIKFDTTVDPDVLAGTSFTIPSTLAYCSAPLARGRGCYTATGSQTLAINAPANLFTVYSTSLTETTGNNLAIGERVVYHGQLTYPKGTAAGGTYAVVVPTTGGNQQQVLSASTFSIGANFNISSIGAAVLTDTSGDSVKDTATFTLPAVRNDPDSVVVGGNIIIFEVVALLTNNSKNVNQQTGNAQGILTYLSTPRPATTTPTKTVIPTLSIVKTHTAPAYIESYSVISYRLNISHDSSSSAPAYSTIINDALPTDLILDAASVQVSSSVGATASVIAGPSGSIIQVTVGTYNLGNGAIIVTYSGTVSSFATASEVLVNNANTTYVSAPSDSFNTNNVRNFVTTTAHAITVNNPTVLFKVGMLTTSLTETTTTNVAIGEQAWLPLELTVPRGFTKNVNLTIALPLGPGKLKAISGEVIVFPPLTTSSMAQGALATLGDTNSDSIKDTITFPLGTILNNATGETNRTITFYVSFLVSQDTAAVNQNLNSLAILTYSNGTDTFTITDSFTLKVVVPTLSITNVATSTSHIASGTVVTFTHTISNSGLSNGPSYYLDIYNGLSTSYKLNVGTVTTTYGNVTTGNTPGDKIVRVNAISILPTSSFTVTFTATLQDIVQPSTTIVNTATLLYSSALYTTFNFGDVKNFTTFANSNRLISSPVVNYRLNYTTITETPSTNITVGEVASLVATLYIPKGTTNNAVLTITMPKTSVKMLMEYARVTYLDTTLGITAYNIGDYIALNDTNSDSIKDQAWLNFGYIFNPSGGVAPTAPTVAAIVEVVGLVINIDANSNGATLPTTANFNYGAALALPPQTINLLVVLPVLSITKTPFLPSSYIEAGSSVQYVVTISHAATSTSPAFDILVIDPLSPLMAIQSATVTTSSGSVVVSSPFVKVTPATLLLGSIITIKYNTTYTNILPPTSVVVNTVNATYYSAPEDGLWNENDIKNTTTFTSAVVNTASPSLVLSLNSTSITQTPSNNVTIGETISFLATINIPHGITTAGSLVINLPTTTGRLAAVWGRIATMSSFLVSSAGLTQGSPVTPTDSNTDTILDKLTFTFGTLTNPFDGTFRSKNGTIVVEIFALVVNHTANTNLAVLRTSAYFQYTNGSAPTNTLSSFYDVRVVLPQLSLVKTATTPVYTEAGSIVQYTLTIKHTAASASAAFNLTVIDSLSSPYLALVAGTVKVSAGNVVTGNTPGDQVISVAPSTTLLTDVVVITYNATLAVNTIAGSLVPNTATVVYASALATDDNNKGKDVFYNSTSGSAQVSIAIPDLKFVLTSTSLSETSGSSVSIGETVTFTATVTVPAGYTNAATLKITLPNSVNGQLSAVFGTVQSIASNINTAYAVGAVVAPSQTNGFNDTVTFAFGNVADTPSSASTDQIVVTIVALVVNTSANINGASLSTSAVFSFNNGISVVALPTLSVPVTVVLPQLKITKSAVVPSVTYLQAGDVIVYTVTVSHIAGTSTAPAYSLVVADDLSSPSLKLVVGTVSSNKGGIVSGNTAGNTAISVKPSVFLTSDSPLVITYNATLTSAAETTTLVNNVASATYASSTANPYNTNNIRVTTISTSYSVLISSPNMTFSLVDTSLSETTGNNVNIGELVTFRSSIIFPHGTTNNVTAKVLLPYTQGILKVVSSVVSYLPATTTSTLLAFNSSGVASDSNGDSINDVVTFNFGTIVSDPSIDGNRVDVDVVALVLDNSANNAGVVLTSNATLTFGAAYVVTVPSVSVVITEPKLKATQSCTPAIGQSGDVLSCTVSLVHTSSVPAYKVEFFNSFDDGTLELVAGSVSTTLGAIASQTSTLSVVAPVVLAASDFVVTFQARLTDSVESSGSADLTTELIYYSAGSNGREDSFEVTTTTQILPPTLAITVGDSSLASTLNSNVTIGETVTVLVTVKLARGITLTPVLTITTGDALAVLSASVVSLGNSASCIATAPTAVISDQDSDTVKDTASFNFGVKLCDSAAGSLGDNVVVQVVSVVSDIPSNFDGTVLPVKAQLSYASGLLLNASTSVEVVEPSLDVTKSTSVASVGGAKNEGISYTITVVHNSASNSFGYDLKLVDVLPDALDLVASTLQVSAGSVWVTGKTINVFSASLPEGSVLTLTYTATLNAAVLAGKVIDNVVDLVYASASNTTVPFAGAERLYEDSANATVVVGHAIITEFIVYNTTLSSKAPNLTADPAIYYFAVGEVVTFHLTTSLPNEASPYINLAQWIPLTSSEYQILSVSALLGSSISVGSSATNVIGDTVWFNFSQVANPLVGNNAGGIITLEVQVVVGDVAQNRYLPSGPSVTTIGSLYSTLANSSRAIALAIVETDLSVTTDVVAPYPSFIEAEHVLNYTVTVVHTNASTTHAYGVNITDFLSSYVNLVVGSVVTSSGTVVRGNTQNDTSVFVSVDKLALGQNVTVRFQAAVSGNAIVSSSFANNASVACSSAPRTIQNIGNVRSYAKVPAPAVLIVASPTFTFNLTSKSNASPAPPTVSIGETAVLSVNITIPKGTSLNTTVAVSLARGPGGVLSLTSASSLSLTPTAHISLVGLTDTDGDNANDTAIFNFGTVANADGEKLGANPALTITLVTLVPNVAANKQGIVLVSNATFTYNNATTALALPQLQVSLPVQRKSGGSGMSAGAIAGIIIGSVGGAAILSAAAFALFKHARPGPPPTSPSQQSLNSNANVDNNPLYENKFEAQDNPLYTNANNI